MAKKNKKKSLALILRNYFITGVVVLIPIGFTLYLSKILIGLSSRIPFNRKQESTCNYGRRSFRANKVLKKHSKNTFENVKKKLQKKFFIIFHDF